MDQTPVRPPPTAAAAILLTACPLAGTTPTARPGLCAALPPAINGGIDQKHGGSEEHLAGSMTLALAGTASVTAAAALLFLSKKKHLTSRDPTAGRFFFVVSAFQAAALLTAALLVVSCPPVG